MLCKSLPRVTSGSAVWVAERVGACMAAGATKEPVFECRPARRREKERLRPPLVVVQIAAEAPARSFI